MTLKYETELLFDLMKRDGEATPSDVLPYESELKEKYLNQVVGAYPKLQDYRPEWLYYNLYYHIPSDFPIESVANVTSASFYNVVPYAYKSAILKGNTDENLQSVKMPVLTTTGKNLLSKESLRGYNQDVKELDGWLIADNGDFGGNVVSKALIENGKTYTLSTRIKTFDGGVAHYCFSHYGKNDFNYLNGNQPFNGVITFTATETTYIDVWLLRDGVSGSVHYSDVQLEEGSVATSYEPYKTNILTVNEEVELRGIGEVQDELNLLTGELTQRIGEIVLNGSENWEKDTTKEKTQVFFYDSEFSIKGYNSGICDKFIFYPVAMATDVEKIVMDVPGKIYIAIEKTKCDSVSNFKTWLSNNNVFIQYILATESIKTVDLSCINEQGESATFRPIEGTMHVNTSSQALPPLLDMSIPIEATTQNLMSFSNISEEE